jgi:hypothetical protein
MSISDAEDRHFRNMAEKLNNNACNFNVLSTKFSTRMVPARTKRELNLIIGWIWLMILAFWSGAWVAEVQNPDAVFVRGRALGRRSSPYRDLDLC